MNYQELHMILKDMDKIPYPKLEEIKPDSMLGKMVYNAYAGSGSELTSITEYVYQHTISEDKEDIARLMIGVAIQEMKHLDILGKLLLKLNLTPYYMGSRNNKWCSDNVKYHFGNIVEMMRSNIKAEEEAIKVYKKLIETTNNNSIRGIFARIIMDEENHIKIFKIIENQYT